MVEEEGSIRREVQHEFMRIIRAGDLDLIERSRGIHQGGECRVKQIHLGIKLVLRIKDGTLQGMSLDIEGRRGEEYIKTQCGILQSL